ncbi:MAG: UbiD family decarboxylase, partial [Chloroflexi bacterium]|nr:UbiD family decarboxylase [Chloroflexota bacterium]
EFVLEGVVPPGERRLEGPFGDHFGHYSGRAEFPVFHVRAITRRRNPVYPAVVVGKPPQEDRYLGDAAQAALIPLIRLMHREIKDLWAYYEAGFHNLLVVSVETRYAREPIRTALGLLGEGQLSLTKVLVLVGPDVDVRDRGAVLKAIRHNFRPEEDLVLVSRAPVDTLDFTGEATHLGSKMIIDATPGRGDAPANAVPIPKDLRAVVPNALRWRLVGHTLLAVQVPGEGRAAVEAMAASPILAAVKIAVAVSDDIDIDDDVELMWAIFTRFDPGRDVVFTETKMRGVLPAYRGVMGIDATWKDAYPQPLEMSPEIVRRVDERWAEYWK